MATNRSAGALRERLHFQRRSLADDGVGNMIPSGPFETQFTAYASLVPRTGGEEVTAARLGGRQPFVCLMRASAAMGDVTTGWQVVDARNANRVLAIKSPPADPDGKNQWLEFLVEQGVAS